MRFVAIITLAILALVGGQSRVWGKVCVGEKLASGVFAPKYDESALVDEAASLEFAGRDGRCGYELVSGQSKWLSRDPIGERGGNNLYSMADNNAVNKLDLKGLYVTAWNSPDVGNEVDLGACGKVKLMEFWGRHSDTVAIVITQQGVVETGAQFQFILRYFPGPQCCCPSDALIGWKQWILSDNDPTQKNQNFPAVDGPIQYRNQFIDTPGITEKALRIVGGPITVEFRVKLGCFKNEALIKELYENEWSISAVKF
jgi:hypothetical protein